MQVILLENIHHLGNLGDVVKVKDGYGRNFLIPRVTPSAPPRPLSPSSKPVALTLRRLRLSVWPMPRLSRKS